MKKVVQLFSELILLANNTSPAKKLIKEDSNLFTFIPTFIPIWKNKTPKVLNYRGLIFILAVWTGLEPATPCVTGMYSNQLNYQTVL